MKKIVTTSVNAVLFVFLALCVSCGGDVPKDKITNSDNNNDNDNDVRSKAHGGGISQIIWRDASSILGIDFNDGTFITIQIKNELVIVSFTPGDGKPPVYDEVMIQGASSAFGEPTISDSILVFSGDKNYLPETATNWAVDFTKSSDPSVLFSFTISAEYTAKVLAALK